MHALHYGGGKLVYAKAWYAARKAKNAAMMSAKITYAWLTWMFPATPDTQPDTPAASELAPTLKSTVKPGAITMPENNGGAGNNCTNVTPSPDKFKETEFHER